jgi:hypothetical protein
VAQRDEMPAAVLFGPLASLTTVYELPDGRQCVVTFANRGGDVLMPIRNARGELWVGLLLAGGVEPATFDEWHRVWIAAELLRPVGDRA